MDNASVHASKILCSGWDSHTLFTHQPSTFSLFLVPSFSVVLSPVLIEGTFIVPFTLFHSKIPQNRLHINLAHGQT